MSETLAIQIMEALSNRDEHFVRNIASETATASGGVFPSPLPLGEAMKVMGALWVALPDFRIEIDRVESRGEEVKVEFMWGGTHSGTLNLPGLTPTAPTEKTVWVGDVFIFRFAAGKIAAVRIESPDGGGIPGLLAQIDAVAA